MYIKSLFSIIKSSKYFLLVYFLFLLTIGFLIVYLDKLEGSILINKTWSNFQDVFFEYITHLGDGKTAILVVLLLFINNMRNGFIALFCFVFTASITQFLKHIVFPKVMRPFIELWDKFQSNEMHLVLSEDLMKRGNSFPSGHTTSAFSLFLILSIFLKKPLLGAIFGVLAVLSGYSRVYLSQHFLEDIFWGSIIGVFGTIFIVVLFESNGWLKTYEKPFFNKKTND